MKNQSKVLTDGDILREFEKRAFQIIKDNWDHFRRYKEDNENIKALWKSEEFKDDLKTVKFILSKYRWGKNIDLVHLLEYQDFDGFLGLIEIEGASHFVHDDLFDTNEGINVIKRILVLLDIEFECRYCLKRPACDVLGQFEKCEGAVEMFNNQFNYEIIKDIINFTHKAKLFQPIS